MPGQVCKEILDHLEALDQALGCMHNSIILGHIEKVYAPDALITDFNKSAEQTALLAQQVAASIPLGGSYKTTSGSSDRRGGAS